MSRARRRALSIAGISFGLVAVPTTTVAAPGKCEAFFLVDPVCEVGKTALGAAGTAVTAPVRAAAGGAMDMLTSWVANSAQWLLGKVVGFIDSSTSPDLDAEWFRERYDLMVGIALFVLLPILVLAVVRSLLAQDLRQLFRCFWPYLPGAVFGMFAAVHLTQTLLVSTDRLSAAVSANVAGDTTRIFEGVGTTVARAPGAGGLAAPSFAIFIASLFLIIGAFFVWLELLVRSAAVTVSVFFLPLIFAGAVWPDAGRRIARRLIETLFALIVSKFVIVGVISLATAAMADPGGGGFGTVMGAVALMAMAAFAPFAIFKLIPVMESSAANHMEGLRYRHQSQLYHRSSTNHVLAIMRSRLGRGGLGGGDMAGVRAPAAAAASRAATASVARGEAAGFMRRLYDLAETIGRPGIAAGLTFGAYLVGVLSTAATTGLLQAIARRLTPLSNISERGVRRPRRMVLAGPRLAPLSSEGVDSLGNAVVDRVLEKLGNSGTTWDTINELPRWVLATAPEVPDHLRRGVVAERIDPDDLVRLARDLLLLPTRLLGSQPELYGSYDRLRAEADFRAAVSVPLCLAFLALGAAHARWWWLAAPFAPLLFYQGMTQLRSAGDVLAVALRAKRAGVESPTLAEVVDRQLTKTAEVPIGVFSVLDRAAPYVVRNLVERSQTASDSKWIVEEAEAWLTRAESFPDDPLTPELGAAAFELARALREHNFRRAEYWLQKAAAAGIAAAQDDLVRLTFDRDLVEAERLIEEIEGDSQWEPWSGRDRAAVLTYELGRRYEDQNELNRAHEVYSRLFQDDFPSSVLTEIVERADSGEVGGERALRAAAEAGWSLTREDDYLTVERVLTHETVSHQVRRHEA